MKVGILGSGEVGRALGSGFASRGHEVKVGSRSPKSAELVAWRQKAGSNASTGTFAEAAKHGDVLLLAVRGTAVEDVIKLAGPENFGTKLLIDATNPLDFSGGPMPGLFIGPKDSLGERIQRVLPNAKIVKCFNTVSNTQMVNPKYAGGAPDMLIAGNDGAAKKEVIGILKEFGWPGAMDVGGIEGARWLEALVPLWVLVGSTIGRWDHAFKVVHG